MNKTFLQIKEADQLVAQMYVKNPNLEKGKFGHAWKRFIEKNYNPVVIEMNENLTDNRIDNALTDPTTKEMLYSMDGRNFKFDKAGLKAINEFSRTLMKEYDTKEIEIKPYIVKEENLPELNEEEREILTGLVI